MKFHVMDHTGHTTLEFNEAQRAEAQETFDKFLAEGRTAGTRKAGAQDYHKVTSSADLQDETVLMSQRQGG